ncbi:hypothetical protein GYA28_04970 [Candidatus Roizmanbacteria bacterium]|nr:hypothetical protein [Candidatus Roizmanbacteria bacterium]
MKTLFKLVILTIVLITSACSPEKSTPAVIEAKELPQCTVVVGNGQGMISVLAELGVNYYNENPAILVNGISSGKNCSPNLNDVIVLENPIPCQGEYIAARKVTFQTSQGSERELSGFQQEISPERVMKAYNQICGEVRWKAGYGYNNDLATGGCAYSTAAKISFKNGAIICLASPSMYESYNDVIKSLNIDEAKYVAVLTIDGLNKDQIAQNCSK